MKLCGQFGKDTDNKKSEKSWHWLRNGSLKRKTKSLLSAAQEQAINTNLVRKNYHKDVSNKFTLCGINVENVLYIMSGCRMLAYKDYKRRNDKVCFNIHWSLCKKYGAKVKSGTNMKLGLPLKIILWKFYEVPVFKWIDK